MATSMRFLESSGSLGEASSLHTGFSGTADHCSLHKRRRGTHVTSRGAFTYPCSSATLPPLAGRRLRKRLHPCAADCQDPQWVCRRGRNGTHSFPSRRTAIDRPATSPAFINRG